MGLLGQDLDCRLEQRDRFCVSASSLDTLNGC